MKKVIKRSQILYTCPILILLILTTNNKLLEIDIVMIAFLVRRTLFLHVFLIFLYDFPSLIFM